MEALGLREGVCQLCFGKFDEWLSAHHVLGKERDPENKLLIALCGGCDDMVTNLAARPWVENSESAADLISLALARRGRFFFQAEDGIRDYKVTGVQTCALPI